MSQTTQTVKTEPLHPTVLVAGATGHLGRAITQVLLQQGYPTHVVVRNPARLGIEHPNLQVHTAQITQPEQLKGLCTDIDVVISTVGITRQKDGLSYMAVDYQANANLVDEACHSGVKKFIYVSVIKADQLRQLQICVAKEKLVDYLKSSGMAYCIIRPNGFFSDMTDLLQMAKKGAVYLFGDGSLKFNPIADRDLAEVIVAQIASQETALEVGGPDILTQNEVAEMALKAYGKPVRIKHLPDWVRRLMLRSARFFTRGTTYGAIEFFLTLMAMDLIAPQYGHQHLADFFAETVKEESTSNAKNK